MQRSSANALAYSLIVDQQMWAIIRNNNQTGFINNIVQARSQQRRPTTQHHQTPTQFFNIPKNNA